MLDDDVKIPNILWFLFAIPLWLMAFVIGNETAESRERNWSIADRKKKCFTKEIENGTC